MLTCTVTLKQIRGKITSGVDIIRDMVLGHIRTRQVWSGAKLRLWSLGQLKTRGWERGSELPHFSPEKSFTVNSITLERLVVPGPYLRGRSGRSTRAFPMGRPCSHPVQNFDPLVRLTPKYGYQIW